MLDILFVTDYVCPYCLVAKEALKQALEATGMEAKFTWQPFELTPEPNEQVDTYHDEKRKAGYQRLVEPCRQLDLPMKLPPKVIPRPYTRLAFEGWYYACEQGKGDAYADLMYRAYFLEELDIGDMNVLADLAERLGLNRAEYVAALEQGTYSAQEKAAVDYSRNVLKPRGVTTIYIDGEKISPTQYTKNEMIEILYNRVSAAGEGGFACGADGCG